MLCCDYLTPLYFHMKMAYCWRSCVCHCSNMKFCDAHPIHPSIHIHITVRYNHNRYFYRQIHNHDIILIHFVCVSVYTVALLWYVHTHPDPLHSEYTVSVYVFCTNNCYVSIVAIRIFFHVDQNIKYDPSNSRPVKW